MALCPTQGCHYHAACSMFASQVVFSFSAMGFCMYMLATNQDSQTTSVYLPIMAGIVSVWMPSPNVPRKINQATGAPSPPGHSDSLSIV